jgi:hypothetical protein
MLSAIGNLIGRKPAPAPAPVRVPFPPTNASPRQRREDPRDTYARVFRFKPTSGHTPQRVEIVGSFTKWQTVSLTHNALDNCWTVTIDGIQGKKTHHYMLLLDGAPAHDPGCDGLALPVGFDEEQFALTTPKGPRVLMLFSQTK